MDSDYAISNKSEPLKTTQVGPQKTRLSIVYCTCYVIEDRNLSSGVTGPVVSAIHVKTPGKREKHKGLGAGRGRGKSLSNCRGKRLTWYKSYKKQNG